MELPLDKILSSFTELLHHHCHDFNNNIVIGCRGGMGWLWRGRCHNNAGSCAGGQKEVQNWNNKAVCYFREFSLNIWMI